MAEFYIGDRLSSEVGIRVVNDQGLEQLILPADIWPWEFDARQDAITIEEFELTQGEQ